MDSLPRHLPKDNHPAPGVASSVGEGLMSATMVRARSLEELEAVIARGMQAVVGEAWFGVRR